MLRENERRVMGDTASGQVQGLQGAEHSTVVAKVSPDCREAVADVAAVPALPREGTSAKPGDPGFLKAHLS